MNATTSHSRWDLDRGAMPNRSGYVAPVPMQWRDGKLAQRKAYAVADGLINVAK